MILGPGANVIKLILSVIYRYSYKSRGFVRLGWKSLPGTNSLAHFENWEVTVIKSFITLGPQANVIKLFTSASYDFS